MPSSARKLRELLNAEGPIEAPGAWDPLTARVLQDRGFPSLMVGGWITGASSTITEPLLTMTEQVAVAGAVARSVGIPVIADGHTGYGDPIHAMRAVREYERAGIAAIHIEDQLFPKRAHYHSYRKHVSPMEEMLPKIRYALEARTDPDFVIIARTDVHDAVGGSLEETIARSKAYRDAGADVLMPFPTPGSRPDGYDLRVGRALAEAVPGIPLVWLTGATGSDKEPSVREIHEAGFKIIMYPIAFLLAAVEGVAGLADRVRSTGKAAWPELQQTKRKVQELIGLDGMVAIERATTEQD